MKTGRKNKLEVKVLSTKEEKKNEEINQPAVGADKVEYDEEKADREKRLLMWVGVSCLMVIFFVVWIFNLKYEFKASLNKSAGNGFNWSQTKTELGKAMEQVKQGLAEIKKIQTDLKPSAKAGEPKLTAEQMNLLKGKLLDEIATGTASSTKK